MSLTLDDHDVINLVAVMVHGTLKIAFEPSPRRRTQCSMVNATVDLMIVEATVLGRNESETPTIPVFDFPVVHAIIRAEDQKTMVFCITVIPQLV